MNPKTIEAWRKIWMPKVYECKRDACLHSRPEGWDEIGHLHKKKETSNKK